MGITIIIVIAIQELADITKINISKCEKTIIKLRLLMKKRIFTSTLITFSFNNQIRFNGNNYYNMPVANGILIILLEKMLKNLEL